MQGLKLLEKAFRLQPVERVPWVPFVGVHGGFLLGVDAQEYLRSGDLMVEGISKAIELYRPDGIPVAFDLQIEAEILAVNELVEGEPSGCCSHRWRRVKLSD
jgi:uroporphyrinogen decarboxylase